jgi:hypothetical protein
VHDQAFERFLSDAPSRGWDTSIAAASGASPRAISEQVFVLDIISHFCLSLSAQLRVLLVLYAFNYKHQVVLLQCILPTSTKKEVDLPLHFTQM